MAASEKLRTTTLKQQKTPVKRYRRQAGAKRTGLRDLTHVNKKYEPRPHKRSASLSKREACDLVG